MTDTAPMSALLAWTCGQCNAQPGERCTTARGRTTATHSDRRDSVELDKRYGTPVFDRTKKAAARVFAESAAANAPSCSGC